MPWALAGRVGVVTGSSSALGKAITHRLAQQHSMKVACVSRQSLSDLPPNCFPFQADLTQADQCDTLCKTVKAQLGTISVLVNCAGVTQNKLHVRSTTEDYDFIFDTNVKGGLNITKSVLRHGGLLPAGDGCIVQIGSVVGLHGNGGQVLYGASKAALSSAVRSWTKEYGSKNIRFNVVAPGLIDGEGMGQTLTAAQREKWQAECPLGRLATVEDVADVVVSLLQCSFVSGQTISVDGGAY
ncbi:KR domain/NAD dependent epimerase/dehydratase family/short chain dehydrogenase/Enoyl-(Acyl carrier protein) reductase, putative [Angomonas deanei]|uniref:KR domain/NAD dependent epimerase/dehydratase family/short chain dehydrogenase/Enoyl-(Acyl carrier protein) reductase, putative n=1 Tax=Angomonas deanei TaxID=59799 RepID=A0A7G2CPY7_9TRYP|nr:KR domain/NAD dependent epimerase/dehydratase family/short chain dehydrogenase/Enoyl-(Acyl carrier protein) reductase, putative [Angomonas deanei]